jgi:malonyl-CoA O-methyltransferase
MGTIDREKVRRSFDRNAAFYEENVVVQKQVRESLLRQLRENESDDAPRRILDVGAGTGALLSEVRTLYPSALLAGLDLAPAMGRTAMGILRGEGGTHLVEGDAECLPFADGAFDLVVSTSTFQWLNTLERAFYEAFRVLSPGGSFYFALFGEDTLRELKSSYRSALKIAGSEGLDHTHRFFSLLDVESALEKVGFSAYRAVNSIEVEYHSDVQSLLRSLRRIGAGNASRFKREGLGGKRVMMAMMEIYRTDHRCPRGIPATYEVICGQGRKL